ncbi:MAG: PilZ domain-containing protein [Deltaproteobacteria bacterium]|nr:PilZ domain-containing protein [Deltaproteobacteria bacterium]
MAKPVRRRDPRLVVNREFRSVEEFIAEYVSNISRTGAFIRTDEPLPVGTRVQLRFTLILDEIETIEGEGEVVRVVKPGGARRGGMGVVFTTLNAYSKRLIEQLMTRRRLGE